MIFDLLRNLAAATFTVAGALMILGAYSTSDRRHARLERKMRDKVGAALARGYLDGINAALEDPTGLISVPDKSIAWRADLPAHERRALGYELTDNAYRWGHAMGMVHLRAGCVVSVVPASVAARAQIAATPIVVPFGLSEKDRPR